MKNPPEKKKSHLGVQELRKRKRERFAILFLAVLFVVLTIAEIRLTKVSNTLPFVNSIFFFGLLNVNIVILTALFWLIFRNIGKLFFERRSRVLGARLKTKLVVAFLAFSITPTLILFAISSFYINSSFDKWFSLKVQNTLQASLEITRTYYRNAERTSKHFADNISEKLEKNQNLTQVADRGPWDNELPQWVSDYLSSQQELLALNAVEYYPSPFEDRMIVKAQDDEELPVHYPHLALDLLNKAFAGERVSVIQHIGTGDLIRSLSPIRAPPGSAKANAGVIVVDTYIPVSLVNKVDEIASVFDDYKDTNPLKYPIKTAYFVILVMITLVLIFIAVWLGLYLARELTVPVERLVRGARQVGAGNLDVEIEKVGQDEIAVLIDSFNKMTRDLKGNRAKLTQAHTDMEMRRQQLEAVLANIGTGVIVVSREETITTFNRAASQLLEIPGEKQIGSEYHQVLSKEAAPLRDLIKRSFHNSSVAESLPAEIIHWHFKSDQGVKSLAGIATPLQDDESNWGVVIVIEDMSHLIKAQREVAWREVARRIAHEIKNPLTPIKLSAQRLQRRLTHIEGVDGKVLQECTKTIVQHTNELKEMVNEFSNFARFPEVSPSPNNLKETILEAVSLFNQAHPQVQFDLNLDETIPVFEFDRDQVKRVLINLVDNAVAAVTQAKYEGPKKIEIISHFNPALKMAKLIIQDNGPGISKELKSRIFEPYFSTKNEGTGLGLAIAKRIINDHDGYIRVESRKPQGTSFVIELPTSVKHELKRKAIDRNV